MSIFFSTPNGDDRSAPADYECPFDELTETFSEIKRILVNQRRLPFVFLRIIRHALIYFLDAMNALLVIIINC